MDLMIPYNNPMIPYNNPMIHYNILKKFKSAFITNN